MFTFICLLVLHGAFFGPSQDILESISFFIYPFMFVYLCVAWRRYDVQLPLQDSPPLLLQSVVASRHGSDSYLHGGPASILNILACLPSINLHYMVSSYLPTYLPT